jgi:ABC-type lipoprotein export system ATPase subunit
MQGKVPVNALRGIDLKVEQGDFISILGPSGSGKSTLLNMIGALDRPTSGQVIINDQDVTRMNDDKLADVRLHIGFVFQYYNLIPRFSALRNIELPMTIKGLPKGERKEKALRLLDSVGLGDRANHKPSELSGGQQQRVAIARAMAQDPTYLLMDEPTGNIDTKNRDEIIKLVIDLNSEHRITTIIITHDPAIAKITNRTLYIVDGLLYESLSDALGAGYSNVESGLGTAATKGEASI